MENEHGCQRDPVDAREQGVRRVRLANYHGWMKSCGLRSRLHLLDEVFNEQHRRPRTDNAYCFNSAARFVKCSARFISSASAVPVFI